MRGLAHPRVDKVHDDTAGPVTTAPRNERSDFVLMIDGIPVAVRQSLPTDEERLMAREAAALLTGVR